MSSAYQISHTVRQVDMADKSTWPFDPRAPDICFPVPPVCAGLWNQHDWDRWILITGHPKPPEEESFEICGLSYYRTDEKNEQGKTVYRRRDE